MADEPIEEPKPKKKSKLPIIVALVLLVATGGFFFVKVGAKSHGPVKIQLSAKEVDLDEFLTNMADGTTYIRMKISVTLRSDFAAAKFTAQTAAVRDAVNEVLRSTYPNQISTRKGLKTFKIALAAAMNQALGAPVPAPISNNKNGGNGSAPPATAIPADWDSASGPVMQVFLSSIATQ